MFSPVRPAVLTLGLGLAVLALAAPPSAQSLVQNTTDIPGTAKDTEQIDFADVDLDGDWDAALANGGDQPPQQNELWINQGGLQPGVTGVFLDETAARLPLVADQSRDVEFADVDGDADPDLYVLRHATITNVGSRWWINQGGKQGGTAGYYQDETAARFVGLGGPGSSIAPSQVLAGGGWIDWSSDGDFGDLDGDGDLDLVHSSYGGAYGGHVPMRMFLNDGDGHFTEFNPSGFQLVGANIASGDPALWCQGLQMDGTTDTTGAFADIADPIVDFEVADVDGDFDCDVLWGTRNTTKPRFFRNLLEQGALGFRDESSLAFPGFTLSTSAFEQELGDLDLYGLNWGSNFFDLLFENQGGVFVNPTVLLGSNSDEEEGDFVDYDNDGDLDLYVANFSGQDELYENLGLSPIAFQDVGATELSFSSTGTSKDCEVADVDLDGDYDVFVAIATGGKNLYMENVTGVPDAARPRIPSIEQVGLATATAGTLRVRAHVYDNAPLYAVWYYPTELAVTVDGVALPPSSMTSSRGQVFRGEIPANLVGAVSYRVRSTDGMGNAGVSGTQAYAATGDTGTSYGSESAAGGFAPPTLQALSEARIAAPLYLAGATQPLTPCFLGIALAPFGPTVVPGLPNLVLNVDPSALVVAVQSTSDAAGDALFAFDVPAGAGGVSVFAQLLDLASDLTFGSSKGLQLTIQ